MKRTIGKVVMLIVLVAFATSSWTVTASAAQREMVEIISVDEEFRPLCAKYSSQNIDERGDFTIDLAAIDGYEPTNCVGWAQKGTISATITEKNQKFYVVGRVVNNATAIVPARILVIYGCDLSMASLRIKYCFEDETRVGMGETLWQERSENGIATFEYSIADKVIYNEVGDLDGVSLTHGDEKIIIETSRNVELTVWNGLDGNVDYIVTVEGEEGQIILSAMRRTVTMTFRHFNSADDYDTTDYGGIFTQTLGDDGCTTAIIPIEGSYVYIDTDQVASGFEAEAIIDEESGFVKQIKIIANCDLTIDLFQDVLSGDSQCVIYADEAKELGETILRLKSVNLPFDGPMD